MSLEDAINRLAAAIEASNGRTTTPPEPSQESRDPAPAKRSTPKAAAKPAAAAAEAPAAKAVTKEAVGNVIVSLIQANQRAAASKILNDHGAKALSELKESEYQAVYDAGTALLETLG